MQAEKDLKLSAGLCLDSTGLDPETFRLGHTKVTLNFYTIFLFYFLFNCLSS